jgi:hypothetical protein
VLAHAINDIWLRPGSREDRSDREYEVFLALADGRLA